MSLWSWTFRWNQEIVEKLQETVTAAGDYILLVLNSQYNQLEANSSNAVRTIREMESSQGTVQSPTLFPIFTWGLL